MQLPAALCSGRYTLVSALGQGAMASVYRAWDHRLRVWRAIKILRPACADKPTLRHRFTSEAQAMAALEHPHVLRVYDVGNDGDTSFIVMELAEGGSPAEWLERNGPMPPRLATLVALQVCEGIAAAHAHGIVHRDIKPQNLLVSRNGRCRVTDFGVALVREDLTDAMTRTGTVMGTLGFMAPEQRQDAKAVDRRADVYAIGATLFQLHTGRIVLELFAAEQDPSLLADVHPLLAPIVAKATRYRPQDRFPTVGALREALQEVLPRLPVDPPWTPPLALPAGTSPPPPLGPKPSGELCSTPPASDKDRPSFEEPAPRSSEEGETRPEPGDPQEGVDAPVGEVSEVEGDDAEDEPLTFATIAWQAGLATLGPAVAMLLVVGALVGGGVNQVSGAAAEAERQAQHYLAAVETDGPELVEALVARGIPAHHLMPYLSALAAAPDAEARLAAADRFMEAAASQLAQTESRARVTGDLQLRPLRVRYDALRDARRSCHAARQAWSEAASGKRARLAITLGAARAPPS